MSSCENVFSRKFVWTAHFNTRLSISSLDMDSWTENFEPHQPTMETKSESHFVSLNFVDHKVFARRPCILRYKTVHYQFSATNFRKKTVYFQLEDRIFPVRTVYFTFRPRLCHAKWKYFRRFSHCHVFYARDFCIFLDQFLDTRSLWYI